MPEADDAQCNEWHSLCIVAGAPAAMAGTVIPWTMRPRATTIATASQRSCFAIARNMPLRTDPFNPGPGRAETPPRAWPGIVAAMSAVERVLGLKLGQQQSFLV